MNIAKTIDHTLLKPEATAADIQALCREAKDATETEAGNIAYWYCEGCGKYFADEALTKEITKDDTVVPAKGQAAQQPTATPGVNPQTGDNSNASVWAAMLSLAAIGAAGTACAAYRKRKAQ